MKLESSSHYYVYIVTDDARIQLHTGVTGDLNLCLYEHETSWMKLPEGPAKDSCCRHLVWWEHFPDAALAVKREEEVSRLSFRKKHKLITDTNLTWKFLNSEINREMKIFL